MQLAFKPRTLLHGSPLTPLQRRFVLHELCRCDPTGRPAGLTYPGWQVVIFWVAQLIYTLPQFTDDQRRLLLRELRDDLERLGDQISYAMDQGDGHAKVPDFIIAVTDGRYVIWHGRTTFLDLETGLYTDVTPPGIVSTAVRLTELVRVNIARYTELDQRLEAQDGQRNDRTHEGGTP